MAPVTVAIVPHTHWDREWYLPFQTFRVRLVHLLDELLDLLEHDLSYARFLLDGQTAVLDDYLAIRPDAAPRLARLAASGRLQVGPWMILMDEFMVSGETLVRDLQLGMARANELGGASPVGYLPDMFGHVAQMPQILRLAGLEHSVVWRGVPNAVTQTAFWWEAPDGSRVRAEYLYGSYSNGRDLPDDAKQLVARAHGYELELGTARLPGGALLLMNGTDHQIPQPWLGRVVTEANAIQDDYEFVVTSLAEYLPTQPIEGLETWSGELRSGARANVLMGVASNRVDVHQVCAAAERALERRAEPLSALFLPPDQYPHALIDVGWRNLVLNSAHDSSCACSHDEVVDAVVVRYQEAPSRRRARRGRAAPLGHDHRRGARLDRGREPDPSRPRWARARLRAWRRPAPLHRRRRHAPCRASASLHRRRGLRHGGHRPEGPLGARADAGTRVRGCAHRAGRREQAENGDWEFTFHAARAGEALLDLEEARDDLLALGEAGATVRFRVVLAPHASSCSRPNDVPGFGWRTYAAADGDGPPTGLEASDGRLANEHLEVVISPSDGTLTLRSADGVVVTGADRLVDGGDGGDTYSYSPPETDRLVDAAAPVRVTTLEAGPVRARLLVERTYEWPAFGVGDVRFLAARSDATVDAEVRTIVELRAGERFVRVRTEIDNRARDHRLRAHFPLPAAVTGSDAECAFAVVHRGLEAEGGPHEAGLPTFVSRRFVDCSDGESGVAVLHDGLLEYEVVDDGRELALTLLRATGYLSRYEPSLRPNPAGPPDPLEGPQLQRRLRLQPRCFPTGAILCCASARRGRRVPRAARARAWRRGRRCRTARRAARIAGRRRTSVSRAARRRCARGPCVQRVTRGCDRDDRSRQARRPRVAHRPGRSPPQPVRGIVRAPPVGDRNRAHHRSLDGRIDLDRLVEPLRDSSSERLRRARPESSRRLCVEQHAPG